MSTNTVLVIEDEPQTQSLLAVMLEGQGYRCLHALSGTEGIATAIERAPGIVLLDLGLPDLDGGEVTRRIREHSRVPIIVVSARGASKDKVAALDHGANDYVTKPFDADELCARIRVALRAARGPIKAADTGFVTIGDIGVDFDLRRVVVRGAEVHLTPTEYRLLSVMIHSAGRVLSNRQILRQVWGASYEDESGYLRIHMKNLRYKIEPEPARPRYLVNVIGVGYRLQLPP